MKQVLVKVISDVVCNNLFKNFYANDDTEIIFTFSDIDQFIPEILNVDKEDILLIHFSNYAFNHHISPQNLINILDEIFIHLEELISNSKVKIILNNFYLHSNAFNQTELLNIKNIENEINKKIYNFCIKHQTSCILVDTANEVLKSGLIGNISYRNYSVMRSPYSRDFSICLRDLYTHNLKNYFNVRKKVIFVDADNTIWGGILGEDGLNNIKVDHEYPGSFYYMFQSMLLNLKNQGVLLCLVTKNNLSDIEKAFEKKDMPLKIDDFTEVRSNWDRKSKNIDDVLHTLNISSSSGVFIDDNPFEIEEVKLVHDDLECIQFDLNNFGDIENKLFEINGLYAHNLTKEDILKSESYSQEKKRKSFLAKSNNINDYLKGLSISIKVYHNDMSLAPRISQLTQKTNQFNLTTRRYSISEIESFIANDNVYAFSVDDKFGEMGVVGVMIVIKNKIDSFLLSCRAFGREIESTALLTILGHLNIFPIYAEYIPSHKNIITKEFYIKNGFSIEQSSDKQILFCLNKAPKTNQKFIQEVKWI